MSDHLIVIPVHNEAGSIGDVVRGAARHGDVLVVDDGSTDGSSEVAASAGADVIRFTRRGGKGAALRRGLTEALARDAQRVVTMDGDGQHDPDDLPRLLAAATQAPDALVIGGRLGGIGERAAAVPLPSNRVAAIRVAGFFINWLTGTAVSDTQSGFRVYPAGLIGAVRPRREGFVLESEMLVGAAARGWRLVEVPVAAIHFAERRSRFRPVRDGTAVGAYLAARIARRWCREAWLIVRALCRPFTAARRRPRHRDLAEFTASHRHHPAALAAAVGVFTVDCTLATWRDWLRDPRVRRMRVAAVATAVTPALLALALATPALRRLGLDPIGVFVDRFYSQERLAGAAPAPPP
jgi:GT2 family glycosyltransferase